MDVLDVIFRIPITDVIPVVTVTDQILEMHTCCDEVTLCFDETPPVITGCPTNISLHFIRMFNASKLDGAYCDR